MLRWVLVDFNGTLARLSRWDASHQEAFERQGLPAVTARWVTGGWWAGRRRDTRDPFSDLEVLLWLGAGTAAPRASDGGVPEDWVELLICDLNRETSTIVMTAYDDTIETTAELWRRSLIVAACFQLVLGP